VKGRRVKFILPLKELYDKNARSPIMPWELRGSEITEWG